MSRQDKATTERNARILRDLVRQPDNRSCADCRKNDARWASWNLGVFLCIRCSGIHRAMGTHISKVKSIDLDIWTPEQMASVQIWGNHRANLYWERHLKKGHVPPDHKIESFIRSKYESRRWAMEGPPPRDPATLEEGAPSASASTSPAAVTSPTTSTYSAPAAIPGPRPIATGPRGAHPLLSRQARPAPAAAPAQPKPTQIIDLFGDDHAGPVAPTAAPVAAAAPRPGAVPATTAASAPATATAAAPQSNIFDLDFKAPSPPAAKPQTAKADIMSLFSQQPTQPNVAGGFFNATATAPVGASGYGSWNGGITSSSPPQAAPTQANVWGSFNDSSTSAWGAPQQQAPQQQQNVGGANPWGSPQASAADPWAQPVQAMQAAPAPKKDERDPFANIWG